MLHSIVNIFGIVIIPLTSCVWFLEGFLASSWIELSWVESSSLVSLNYLEQDPRCYASKLEGLLGTCIIDLQQILD